MNILIGIFIILHGLVHLLYMGHSLKYFELEKGFEWPHHSFLFSKIFGQRLIKIFSGILCVIAALGFIVAGILVLVGHSLHNPWTMVALTSSTVLFIVFWDGRMRKLHTQGGIAILINLLILYFAYMQPLG